MMGMMGMTGPLAIGLAAFSAAGAAIGAFGEKTREVRLEEPEQ